ncbi:MAG: tyrosine-type recombinase/integrase [Mycobacterium sp.]|nr:tyrosine-type recombinase/integrase [Mycobacterium sp.]
MTRNRRGWGHIRKLPSKRFQASYVGPDIRRHHAPTTYTGKMDAEGWLANERRLIERGEWTPPASRGKVSRLVLTLRQYSETWVAQRTLKPRTRAHYEILLAEHVCPALGDIELASLAPQTIRSWYSVTLVDRPTYRAHAYGLLHAICATAVKDGLLTSNPCQIDRAMSTHRKAEPTILTVEEVSSLADAIEPRFRALILISAWCGLRFGEVTELRRQDVGTEIITVARGVTHSRGGCHVSSPKSGRGRSVVVPPHIRPDLKHHLDTFVDPDPQALLFAPVLGGCHLRGSSLKPHFDAALGRKGVRIHDLRHFAGTQVARVGTLKESMDRLGHSTVQASLMYQGMVSGRDVEIAEELSKLATDTT